MPTCVLSHYFQLQQPILCLLELLPCCIEAANFFKEHAQRCELLPHWLFENFTRFFVRKGFIKSNYSFFHSLYVSLPFERVTGTFQVLNGFFFRVRRKVLGDHRCSYLHRCHDTLIPMRLEDMWQTQTSKLPQQQCEKQQYVADANFQATTALMRKERICGRRKRPNYHNIHFP